MKVTRALQGFLVVGALVGACRSDPGFRSAPAGARAASPEASDRAACLRGQYPISLDAGALARARQVDLQAAQSGTTSTFEASRLLDARAVFERRCQSWLAASAQQRSVEPASFPVKR